VGYQQKLRRVVSEMYWGRRKGEDHFMLPEILKIFSSHKEDLCIHADFPRPGYAQCYLVHIVNTDSLLCVNLAAVANINITLTCS
jgi:hypothetical protein